MKTSADIDREHAHKKWIGVDLDGTLAEYSEWVAWNVIGPPIVPMVLRVRKWIADGRTVKIFTARMWLHLDQPHAGVFLPLNTCRKTGEKFSTATMGEVISDWAERHVGHRLEATSVKSVDMEEFWDDKAVQVIPNTGRTLAEEHEAEMFALRGKP